MRLFKEMGHSVSWEQNTALIFLWLGLLWRSSSFDLFGLLVCPLDKSKTLDIPPQPHNPIINPRKQARRPQHHKKKNNRPWYQRQK
jgi:hypothetical protein